MASITETAAEWLHGLGPADLPGDVIAATKLRILDVIGLALAAAPTRFGTAMRDAALAMGGTGRSRILLSGERTSPHLAALANGAMSQALQFDDTHMETVIHMSSPNVAAALAWADEHGCSGRDVLLAIAAGNEFTCRFGLPAPGRLHRNGFHPSGIFGTLGATCTAAKLMGLDVATTVRALGIAGSFASGLIECWTDGTDTQFVHPGWSAHSGLKAVLLARAGVTGPATVLEGRFGLFAAHVQDRSIPYDFARSVRALGQVWESRNASFKPYPAAHVIHAFIDALLALRAEHRIDAAEVDEITCPIAPYMIGLVCEPQAEKIAPPNDVRARVSLPWSVAEALVRGSLGADAYAPQALANPQIQSLARRVRFRPDDTAPGTERYRGWIILQMSDGRRLELVREHNHGSPADPMTGDEIRAKFLANVAATLSERSAAAIIDAADTLEQAPTVHTLMQRCVR